MAILETFEGANFWLYYWFERATVGIYWASLIPLAALFDWVRKMFELGKAIQEAKKAEIRDKAERDGLRQGLERGLEQGRKETEARIQALLDRHGITLPPKVSEDVFGGATKNGS